MTEHFDKFGNNKKKKKKKKKNHIKKKGNSNTKFLEVNEIIINTEVSTLNLFRFVVIRLIKRQSFQWFIL